MKEKNILLIFHKPLDQIDGQTKYIKVLIDIISLNYNIVIPSESFYSNSKWKNRNWVLRTVTINLYLVIWIFRNRQKLKKKFSLCIVEDRYTLLPAFCSKFLGKLRLISHVSDWGKRYVDSLNLRGKMPKYLIKWLGIIYEKFTLRYSYAIIVPSDYIHDLIKISFKGTVFNFPFPYSMDILKDYNESNNIVVSDYEHDVYCAFVANFNYPPNENSANFILKELSPKIKEKDGRIKFLLVGPGSKEKFSMLCSDNVASLGMVDNLYELYEQCQIGINPSQTVGGTSSKNIEYLASGLLVVSTEEAAAGVIKSSHLFIEKREGFLELILDLANKIRSGENITEEKETERIKKYYSKTEIKENTLTFLDEISKKSH